MDAIAAVLGPGDPRADCRRMLDAVWPGTDYQEASWWGAGIALVAARTAGGAAAVGGPTVHHQDARHAIQRFDWPSLAGPAPAPWWGTTLAPHPDSSTSIAWDESERVLFVARDPMGESPLWYAHREDRLALSSAPDALRALPWVSDEPALVARYAMEGRFPLLPAETGWRDLHRLPAGHLLIATAGGLTIQPWWRAAARPPDAPADDGEWFRRIRSALERAVARRLPRQGTVGAHLSGGLDSTAVALLGSRALLSSGRALHTFSHIPAVRWHPPQSGDETPYIEAALTRMPNAVPHFVTGTTPLTGPRYETPTPPHNLEVGAMALEQGIGTILSGWGGDEGVSYNGDGHLAHQLLRGQLWWVLRWCRHFGGGSMRGMTRTFYHKVVRQSMGALPATPGAPPHRAAAADVQLADLPPAVRRELLQRQRRHCRLRRAPSARENQCRLLASSHLALRIDQEARWSTPLGFAVRYPLLDPGLLTLVLTVPERLCILDGRTRTLLRQALLGTYPDLIHQRHGKFVSHPPRVLVVDR